MPTIIAVAAIAAVVVLAYYALILRQQRTLLREQVRNLRWRTTRERQRANVLKIERDRYKEQRDEAWANVGIIQEYTGELERRNVWLEQGRWLVLRKLGQRQRALRKVRRGV